MMKELFLTPEAASSSGRFISYGARRSLLLAGLSFSALLTIMAPITVNHGLHITFNQAWADSEGGDGGDGGDGGGDGDGGDGDGGDNGDNGDNSDAGDDNGDSNDDQGDNSDDQGDNSDDNQESSDTADEEPDDIPPPAQ